MSIQPTIADLMSYAVPRAFEPTAPSVRHDFVEHYANDSSSTAWLAEMRAMETEGELTPAQAEREPHEAVMDPNTPALLRKQAA